MVETSTTGPRRNDRYVGMRSIMESPIMDDRKWSKVPSIPADCFMLDLEDSVAPAQKDAARERVVEHLAMPDFFQGKHTMARPNHLTTPWGRDDLVALAEAGVTCMAYPKVNRVDELQEVLSIMEEHGAQPDVFAILETAESVENVTAIADHPNVVGLMFGPGDLSVDSGIPLFSSPGVMNDAFTFPRVQTTLAAAARGMVSATIAFALDLKDQTEVAAKYRDAARLGFTTGITFYPPHVPILNTIFGPDEEAVERATEIIRVYEAALGAGEAAVSLDDGTVLLVHDYEKALHLRDRAAAVGLV